MSSREPNILDDPELYTSIVLGGRRSPGVVTLSGHDRNDKWDVQAGAGQDGASTSRKGTDPTTFTASFYLCRDNYTATDDFEFWPSFLEHINSTIAGSAPKALDIYHPSLAANGIKSVCRASVGGEVPDNKGGVTVAVKFIEYRPPKKKSGGSPSGSKGAASAKDDPNAAALKELEALTKKYQETPWG
jgi:hypothetical protein